MRHQIDLVTVDQRRDMEEQVFSATAGTVGIIPGTGNGISAVAAFLMSPAAIITKAQWRVRCSSAKLVARTSTGRSPSQADW